MLQRGREDLEVIHVKETGLPGSGPENRTHPPHGLVANPWWTGLFPLSISGSQGGEEGVFNLGVEI